MATMLKVKATRTFNSHSVGDVLLVEETDEIRALIASNLFDILAIETDDPTPVATPSLKPVKAKAKGKGKAAKNV